MLSPHLHPHLEMFHLMLQKFYPSDNSVDLWSTVMWCDSTSRWSCSTIYPMLALLLGERLSVVHNCHSLVILWDGHTFSPANQSGQYLIPSCLYATFFTDAIEMSILKSILSGYCRKQHWRQGKSGALNDAFQKSGVLNRQGKSGVLNGQGNSGVGMLNDAFRKRSFLNDAFLLKSGVLSDAFCVLSNAFQSCFLAYSLWTWIGGDVGWLFFYFATRSTGGTWFCPSWGRTCNEMMMGCT